MKKILLFVMSAFILFTAAGCQKGLPETVNNELIFESKITGTKVHFVLPYETADSAAVFLNLSPAEFKQYLIGQNCFLFEYKDEDSLTYYYKMFGSVFSVNCGGQIGNRYKYEFFTDELTIVDHVQVNAAETAARIWFLTEVYGYMISPFNSASYAVKNDNKVENIWEVGVRVRDSNQHFVDNELQGKFAGFDFLQQFYSYVENAEIDIQARTITVPLYGMEIESGYVNSYIVSTEYYAVIHCPENEAAKITVEKL